ncbi:MAG: DUF362 domain-containing protein, partial [Planctomycetes bacterium]|nr:DUF362 domain-containing protein [Planctomycetota bacterium]
MSCKVSRRTFLTRHLPAAGLLAGGGLSALAQTRAPREIPDRSADAPSLPVAVARCASYEPKLLRAKVDTILGQIGGIGKLVQGKTVSIKLNLTGGPRMTLGGLPAYRTYHVHPNMVAALAAAVADAGARRIVIIESNYSDRPIEEVLSGGGWDIAAIKSAGSHRVAFEDTRNRGQWPAYSRLKVSGGGLIYP